MFKVLKISFYLLFLFHLGTAQEVVSIHLNRENGLPDKRVYDMTEDSLGYIWLASNSGLYRYDGKEYKKFTNVQQKGRSVFELKFDYKGRLWCSNVNGQFFYVENDSLHLGLSSQELFGIEEKLQEYTFFDKKLFLTNNNRKILAYDLERKTLVNYTLSPPVHDNNILIISGVVANDSLFFLTEGQNFRTYLYAATPQDTVARLLYEFKHEKDNMNPFYLHNLYVHQGKKTIWSPLKTWKTGTQIMQFDNEGLLPIKYPRFFEKTRLVLPYSIDEKIWFTSNQGLHILDNTITDKLEHERTLFPHTFTTKAIKDQNENYWVSTLYEGIHVIPNLNLEHYSIPDTLGLILCTALISEIQIAFGTDKGKIGILNLHTGQIELIPQDKHRSPILKIFHNPYLNEFYISTENYKYSHTYNIKKKKLITTKKTFFNATKALCAMSKDSILTMERMGVKIYTKENENETNKFTVLSQDSSRIKRTYDGLFVPESQKIYVAFLDELIVYNRDLTTAKRIQHKDGSDVLAKKIIHDKNGTIWAITFKNGLLKIKNDTVQQIYNTKNGLLDNNIQHIVEDGDFLWLYNTRSIQKFNPQTETFQNLTTQDGFIPEVATGFYIIKNQLYYSSSKHFFTAHKQKIFKQPQIFHPTFTHIEINDIPYPIQEKYSLSPQQKKLRVRFNTNGFHTHVNTHYRYRIKGFSDKWENVTQGINEVVINNMPKGQFTFELQAINPQGTSSTIHFGIRAKSVFYKQWWFILLCFSIVIAIIYFYFQRLMKSQAKRQTIALERQRNETEKVYLKLENIRSQMNPHFVFNALNSIQDYIILNQKDLAGDYLGKFADLIRMYLDQSRKKHLSLQEEITTLHQYLELEKLRFEDKIEYQIIVDKNIEQEIIQIPTMLIQPYVENSIKHGFLHKKGIGHLEIRFELKEKYLHCTIFDDGVGRKKSQAIQAKRFKKHSSFSTQAIQNRVELLNHEQERLISVHIEDLQEPVGTKVTVIIPV